MNDTSRDMDKKMRSLMAERTPLERLQMACSMLGTGHALVRAGLKHQDPTATEAQLRARMLVRLYGDSFTWQEIEQITSRMPDMALDGICKDLYHGKRRSFPIE